MHSSIIRTRGSCSLAFNKVARPLSSSSSSSANHQHLLRILEQVQQGQVSPQDAFQRISNPSITSIPSNKKQILTEFANLDHERSQLAGFPEAVFAQGKTPEQVASILDDMARHVVQSGSGLDKPILATR